MASFIPSVLYDLASNLVPTSWTSSTSIQAPQADWSLPLESKNLLKKTHNLAFTTLSTMNHKERETQRKHLAEEVLKKGKAWKKHADWRQFALMHCPGIIKETSLEGGSEAKSVYATTHFLNACLSEEGLFFDVGGVPKSTFTKLLNSLFQFRAFLTNRPEQTEKTTSKEVLEQHVEGLFEQIKTYRALRTTGVYLPLGYRHGSTNQGHSIVCKIQEDVEEDEIIVSLFNLGNGSEPHPVLNYTLGQKKTSFSFYPIAIPKKIFFGEVGKAAFCYLFRYLCDAPKKCGAGYDGHDIYDIFFQFFFSPVGKARLYSPRKLKEYEADIQISGNCPQEAIRCIIEDVGIQDDIPRAQRTKILLNRDFFSLIAHYHDFVDNPSCHPSARELLHDGAKSFGATVNDLYKEKQISEEEFIAAQAVVHKIVKAAKDTPYPAKSSAEEPLFAELSDHRLFEALPSLKSTTSATPTKDESVSGLVQIKLKPPAFSTYALSSAAELPKALKEWTLIATDLPQEESFQYVSDCIRYLPIPTSRDDDFWKELPPNLVAQTLSDLEGLLKQGLRGVKVAKYDKGQLFCRAPSESFVEQFLIIYSVYAIADRLCRGCEDSKLEGFSSPFLPFGFAFEPHEFASLPLAEDNKRFTAISQYFTGKKLLSDKGYKDRTIFPIAPILNVQQFVSDLLSGGHSNETWQGRNHVEYLARFLPNAASGSETNLASHCCKNWKAMLPSQVQSLYYFSFLSHTLFSAIGMPFPSTLDVAIVSHLGKAALKIQNPFFPIEEAKQQPAISLFGKDHKPKLDKPLYDKRFSSLQPHVPNFIDIHSPEIKALKTNDAICYLLAEQDAKDWSIDESAIRKLLYDTRQANLSLWQVLQDFTASENHYLLEHPGVQNILDTAFFQPHFLLERLAKEPVPLISAFRKFIAEGLRRYNDNHTQLKAILFLVREGICFESYLPDSLDKMGTLRFYKTTLEKLLKGRFTPDDWANIFSHLRFLDMQTLNMQSLEPKEDLLFEFFNNHVNYFLNHKSSTWVYSYLPRLNRQLAYCFYTRLSTKSVRNELCEKILNRVIRDQEFVQNLGPMDWEGDFPQYSCGDLVIDFFHCTIWSKKHDGALQYRHFSKDERVHGVTLNKYGNFFWVDKEGGMVSLSGKLKFCPKQSKWFELLPGPDGSVQECEISGFDNEEIERYGQDFLQAQEDLPFVHYKKPGGSILSYDRKTNKPYLLMETVGSKVVYTRLDDKANKLPFTLTNIEKLQRTDPLYPYTIRYAHPSEILCFVDETKKQIHEVNFYKLGLQFANDSKGLVWAQNKEFYLIGRPQDLTTEEEKKEYRLLLQELNGYEGAIVLYNPTSKKWNVLFPISGFSKIAQKEEDFSRIVEFGKAKQTKEYFQFEFDMKEKSFKTLKADHDRSNAYLALLYKLQRDYSRSTYYLGKIKTTSFFKEDTLEMLGHFTDVADYHPASLAFNLKLSLKVIKNKNLMLEKQFSHNPSTLLYKNFLRFAMENYKLYRSKNNESKAPAELRLSAAEKKMLVLAFRRFYQEQNFIDKEGQGWEERWKKEQPVLDAQFQVYFSSQEQNTLIPAPQKIPLVPPIFSSLKKPDEFTVSPSDFIGKAITKYQSNKTTPEEKEEFNIEAYPIRVSEKAIAINFVKLFWEAQSCPEHDLCEFDFKLQTFLKAHSDVYLGHLLFWVRHFPEEFEDCTIPNAPKWNDYKRLFDKIFERVKEIPKRSPDKFAKFEKSLAETFTFRIKNPIPLSAEKETYSKHKVKLGPASQPPPDLKTYVEDLEKQIYRLFNSPYKVKDGALTPQEVEQETKFLLGKDSSQILSFPKKDKLKQEGKGEHLPEEIMKQVIQRNNLGYLYKHRSMLSVKQMRELCRLTCAWYHARMLLKLKQEGKEHLYIEYDYNEYPEIAYNYLKSGKFPTKVQMETFQWGVQQLKAGKKCHFQLPTGAGKSDVLTPLFHMAAKRLGFLAASCVTQSIYPIEKENLSYNLRQVGEDLCYLEIGMHMVNQLSALDLQYIYTELMQYKAEGKSLIFTKNTMDALFLIRELALKSGVDNPGASSELRLERGGKISFSQKILNLFEEKVALICDESHQNADPLTRAIVGTGDFSALTEEESQHLAYMTSLALKCKAPKNSNELKAIQTPLVQDVIDKICPTLGILDRKELIAFCTDESAKQPEILRLLDASGDSENKRKANLIALTSHFCLDLLPEIYELKTNVDHARSLYPQRKYEVPAYNEMPSTSEYDDKYKTCVLTTKGNEERGLLDEDIRLILTDMVKDCIDEKTEGFESKKTPSNERFQKWLSETSLKNKNTLLLEDIKFSDKELMRDLQAALGSNPSVIDYFLSKYAFSGIGTPLEQLSCTTSDVAGGVKAGIWFSATPRDKLCNPRCISEYRADPEFEAAVKKKMKEPQNRNLITFNLPDPLSLLAAMDHNVNVLLDPRGFFKKSSREVARIWMAHNKKFDGVIHFSEARSTDVDRNEKMCLLMRDGRQFTLEGSNIRLALKEHNLELDKLNLGFHFPPKQTESANVVLKEMKDIRAYLLVGEGLTTSHAIQTITRCRGFLDGDQTIATVMTDKLCEKIYGKKEPTVEILLDWLEENQRIQEKKRIILNGFQEILYAVAKRARLEIKEAHANDTSPTQDAVIEAYEKRMAGFIEKSAVTAFQAFGEHEVLDKTETVLEAHAKKSYEKFAYETLYEEAAQLKTEINAIIADVKAKITHIPTKPKNTQAKIEHHFNSKSNIEREQKKMRPRPSDAIALEGEYGSTKISSPDYVNAKMTPVAEVLQCPFLTSNLYFEHNHKRTAKLADTSDEKPQVLKPIHYFVLLARYDIEHECTYSQAIVTSHEILSGVIDDLASCPKTVKDLEHQAALFTATGKLVENGGGALKVVDLSGYRLDYFIQDISILNGKIPDTEDFYLRLKSEGWAPFEALWNEVKRRISGGVDKAQTKAFEELKERFFRENRQNSV